MKLESTLVTCAVGTKLGASFGPNVDVVKLAKVRGHDWVT